MIQEWIRVFQAIRKARRLPDVPAWQRQVVERVRPFTMTGTERILATISAVEYVVQHGIPGAIVECGVWKGGQMMAVACTLAHMRAERPLYLFDTFEGMTAPEDVDRDLEGNPAEPVFSLSRKRHVGERWCEARLEEVRQNLASTKYPEHLLHFIVGPVEQTLPAAAPPAIAYLRLDTDWYASTMHELDHLYPRVSSLGVIAIDDYGHWEGARKATDEYLSLHRVRALLHRIDYSGRQFVKI